MHREQLSPAEAVPACLVSPEPPHRHRTRLPPLCPHSLCDLRQQPALSLPTRTAGAGTDDSKVPSASELQSPAWAAPSATHPRPVDTRASVGRNRNPRQTKREGRCGGHGGDRRDEKCIQCPRQHHQPLQVHAWKFMAPSPDPGDLSPACHSRAFFILHPPSVCIIRHPPGHLHGLPVSCRDIQTPQVHAPLLINSPAVTASSGIGSSANGPWAPKGERTAGGVGALAPEGLENPTEI